MTIGMRSERVSLNRQGTFSSSDQKEKALMALGKRLLASDYRFTTVTPVTHQRVNARPGNEWASSITDVFGWSRPFIIPKNAPSPIPPEIHELMHIAQILEPVEEGWRSKLRASTLDGDLYFHSAFPTEQADAVFFGPDTYRFIRALKSELPNLPVARRAVDIGCGAGPGALTIAGHYPHAQTFAVDINDAALKLTEVNARLAKRSNVVACNSNLLTGLTGDFDLIVSNPPYLVDRDERTYRHGGGALGADLSLDIVDTSLERLAPGGTLLLYTGAAIFKGHDPFLQELKTRLDGTNCVWSYEEIDPDVFGEELNEPSYRDCDRIAAVWLKVCNRG